MGFDERLNSASTGEEGLTTKRRDCSLVSREHCGIVAACAAVLATECSCFVVDDGELKFDSFAAAAVDAVEHRGGAVDVAVERRRRRGPISDGRIGCEAEPGSETLRCRE